MKIKQLVVYFVVLYIPLFSSQLIAASDDEASAMVKGFAKYQAGRIENIILDQFLKDLATEKYMKRFFPHTSGSINGYSDVSGKRLMPLIKYYVSQDLEALKNFASCVKEKIDIPDKIDKGKTKRSLIILDELLKLRYDDSYSMQEFLGISLCKAAVASEKKSMAIKNVLNLAFKDSKESDNAQAAAAVSVASTEAQEVEMKEEEEISGIATEIYPLSSLGDFTSYSDYINAKLSAYVSSKDKEKNAVKLLRGVLDITLEAVDDEAIKDANEKAVVAIGAAVNELIAEKVKSKIFSKKNSLLSRAIKIAEDMANISTHEGLKNQAIKLDNLAKEVVSSLKEVVLESEEKVWFKKIKSNAEEVVKSVSATNDDSTKYLANQVVKVAVFSLRMTKAAAELESRLSGMKNDYLLLVEASKREEKMVDLPAILDAVKNISIAADEEGINKASYAVYVHQLGVILSALSFDLDDRAGFQKFKSSSLFLASLADAANLNNGSASDAVVGVIDEFVKEDVVYKNKRNSMAAITGREGKSNLYCTTGIFCQNTWFVGSYYGVSAGRLPESENGKEHVAFRAFGPVGVEFKLFSGLFLNRDTTITFMAAPIDIGIYITDELKGDEYKVKFEDIASPSYFLSFSSKRSPMSWQFGYQKDIPISDLSKNTPVAKKESMYFVAFSFDLPLFTLW